jgi:hypothetical protein
MEAMIAIRDAVFLIRLLAQMGLLSPFSIDSTTPDEIHDSIAVCGDSLLG